MTSAALRPRTTSEIVDAGFQLTRENFMPLAMLSALIAIPALVVTLVNAHIAPPGVETPAAIGNRLLLMSPLLLLSSCWFFVVIGALVYSSSEAYHGRAVDPGPALRAAFARAPSLIGGNLLAYVMMLALFIAGVLVTTVAVIIVGLVIFLPLKGKGAASSVQSVLIALSTIGIVLGGALGMLVGAARYVNVTAAVILEQRSAIPSLTRSAALSLGHRKSIVALLALGFAIFLVVAVGAAVFAQSVLQNPVLVNAISSLVSIVLYPLLANILTVLYYDLRIRKEGYDIEELSRRLGAGTAPAVP